MCLKKVCWLSASTGESDFFYPSYDPSYQKKERQRRTSSLKKPDRGSGDRRLREPAAVTFEEEDPQHDVPVGNGHKGWRKRTRRVCLVCDTIAEDATTQAQRHSKFK